jgi:chromosome segregation ATPase
MDTALNLHDALLLNMPAEARHDSDICPFCADWSMAEDGIPSGFCRLDLADAKAPYGNVEYADPGYQKDGVKRYPIDTEAHARAAWSYIHQASNSDKYNADQLASIRTKISAALERFGVEAENKEVEKTKKLADAKSSSKVSNNPKESKASDKSSSASNETDALPDAASEGGTTKHMDTITQETHEALLEKALRDATASLEAEKAELESKVATLTEAASAKESEIASLQSENERLNGELDTAQVSLKAATDEAQALKADIASKEAEQAKADIAAARATQVRNLGLFTEEYITEKASRWAEVDEAAWNDRLDEWKVAKGTSASAAGKTTDTASAMTGTSETQTGSEPTSARRAALGLGN